ncbi:hypothetical protein [Lactococcus kimchii]|nr:hypothetical protein [Lactococcus sp. S-13]
MTFLQINIALMTITIVLASLMGACLIYTMRAVKARLNQFNDKKETNE